MLDLNSSESVDHTKDQPSRGTNLLVLDENENSLIFDEVPKPLVYEKPKVNLTESDLLGGFMAEFGLSSSTTQ